MDFLNPGSRLYQQQDVVPGIRQRPAQLMQCCFTLKCNVSIPRITSQLSKGPSMAPHAFWINFIFSPSCSSFVTTSPAIRSLWPPRYFVAECTTISAPSERGCCKAGEAKVLSTQSKHPVGLCNFCNGRDIADFQCWIGGSFDPYQFCFGGNGIENIFRIGGINIIYLIPNFLYTCVNKRKAPP